MNSMAVINEVTMTSRQIAEITGKNHFHVLRDIRNVIESLATETEDEMYPSLDRCYKSTTYTDNQGREYEEYVLSAEAVLDLMAGYDRRIRRRVIRRVLELEDQQRRGFVLSHQGVQNYIEQEVSKRIREEMFAYSMLPTAQHTGVLKDSNSYHAVNHLALRFNTTVKHITEVLVHYGYAEKLGRYYWLTEKAKRAELAKPFTEGREVGRMCDCWLHSSKVKELLIIFEDERYM